MRHSWFALVLMVGCVDADDPEDAAELGETEQEVSSTVLETFTCSTTPSCRFDLGSDSNRACFLAGIRGPAGGLGGSFGSYTSIYDTGSTWALAVYPPAGGTLKVTTACVSPAGNVTKQLWNSTFPTSAEQIPNTTPQSRCFLSIFSGQAGGLTHYNDSIKTWKDSAGKWWIGGSTVGDSYLSGGAICFDVAVNHSTWAWGQGSSGSITGDIGSNSTGGVACGLTELGGKFTTNSTSDGVHINYLSGSAQWIWTFVNYKHAHANCIK